MAGEPEAPPQELVDQLEETIGTPPPINDPVADMPAALAFHNLNITGWKQTMKVWNDPAATPFKSEPQQ